MPDLAPPNGDGLDDRLHDALQQGADSEHHSLDELIRLLTDGCARLHELELRSRETEPADNGSVARRGRGEIELLRERLAVLRARVIGARKRP
jgi:hypothetical protein